MYPALGQVVEPGERNYWGHIDTTYVNYDDRAFTEWREFGGTPTLLRASSP